MASDYRTVNGAHAVQNIRAITLPLIAPPSLPKQGLLPGT